MDLTVIRVKTDGLYENDRGFASSQAAGIWDDYWRTYKGNMWRVYMDDFSVFLVSVYGGGMIHAEGFTLVIQEPIDRTKLLVRALQTALDDLTKKLNFTYVLTIEPYTATLRQPWTRETLFSTPKRNTHEESESDR